MIDNTITLKEYKSKKEQDLIISLYPFTNLKSFKTIPEKFDEYYKFALKMQEKQRLHNKK